MISVYMDVCCLNHPFDDQTQDRVRLETDAVFAILQYIEAEEWVSVSSEAVQDEIDSDANLDRKSRIQEFASLSKRIVAVQQEHLIRAGELKNFGFRSFDALHIACAEQASVDAFLTTDDHLLRLALRFNKKLTVKVANPAVWLLEVQNDH